MPASTLYELYRFEDVVESAMAALLTANTITNAIQQGTGSLSTPRVEIQFTPGSQDGQYQIVSSDVRPCCWDGELKFRIITNRGVNKSTHKDYRSKIRMLMHNRYSSTYWSSAFHSTNLPYHDIMNIEETGTAINISADDNLDESEITFKVKFGIKSDAWPT